MTSPTLEHRVIGPGSWLELVSQLEVVDGVPQMDPVSVVQVARKNGERRIDGAHLTNFWCYVGDGNLYGLDDKNDVWLYLTKPSDNPGLKNPGIFARQLRRYHDYFFRAAEPENLMAKASDGSVLAVNLSQLERDGKLTHYTHEFSYIGVKTEILKAGRSAFFGKYGRIVANLIDRIHGDAVYTSSGLGPSLFAEDKEFTAVKILTPDYVVKELNGKDKGIMLSRASCIDWFGSLFLVSLAYRDIHVPGYARGLVKSAR